MKTIKLSEWCDKRGVSYLTAWRWFKKDKMPVNAFQTETGTILVEDDEDIFAPPTSEETQQDNSLAIFLKKTIEFSKNNSTVEDFAGYILSNFQLKLIGQDQPKYSRNKPKPEEVQKHFKKFLPTNVEKPVPCAFIPEPEVWETITDNTETFVGTNESGKKTDQGLVNQIRLGDEGVLVTSEVSMEEANFSEVEDLQQTLSNELFIVNSDFPTKVNFSSLSFNGIPESTGGVQLCSDLNPQNYTYSTNYASSSFLGSSDASLSLHDSPVFVGLYNALNKADSALSEKPKRGRPRKK